MIEIIIGSGKKPMTDEELAKLYPLPDMPFRLDAIDNAKSFYVEPK